MQQKIDDSRQLKDPEIRVNVASISMPGIEQLGQDLGESQITGEVGAPVEGYGAALSRVTQELLRMMREEKVLVVWLFDESDSMKDDQQQIREQFHKVYEELGIVAEKDSKLKGKEVLLTAIHSFGKGVNMLTKAPTADVHEIRGAIDRIPVDETGKENMCQALVAVLDRYKQTSRATHRKLVVVLVTDESGDDGELIDEAVNKAKRLSAPVYILGRESIFGYPYAHIRWKDPQFGLEHWLRINRGPETPEPEALQYDGLGRRWDAYASGFGPYEQARLAKDTGGIFFVLPHEEENLIGQESAERRKFAFLDLKEYAPDLSPRRTYEEERARSKFRSTIWEVIKLLNPYLDKELTVREWPYSIDAAEFQKEGQVEFAHALRAMGLLNQAAQVLHKIKPLRDQEESQRWRANYDLILAQCMAYRVRLFQFMLALDAHSRDFPQPKNPKSNMWHLGRVPQMLSPSAQQIKLTKVDMEELKRQEQAARAEFMHVIQSHPGTPWAHRAATELSWGFGMKFYEDFRDPRYKTMRVKLPNP